MAESGSESSGSEQVFIVGGRGGRRRLATEADLASKPNWEPNSRLDRQLRRHAMRGGLTERSSRGKKRNRLDDVSSETEELKFVEEEAADDLHMVQHAMVQTRQQSKKESEQLAKKIKLEEKVRPLDQAPTSSSSPWIPPSMRVLDSTVPIRETPKLINSPPATIPSSPPAISSSPVAITSSPAVIPSSPLRIPYPSPKPEYESDKNLKVTASQIINDIKSTPVSLWRTQFEDTHDALQLLMKEKPLVKSAFFHDIGYQDQKGSADADRKRARRQKRWLHSRLETLSDMIGCSRRFYLEQALFTSQGVWSKHEYFTARRPEVLEELLNIRRSAIGLHKYYRHVLNTKEDIESEAVVPFEVTEDEMMNYAPGKQRYLGDYESDEVPLSKA